MVKKIILNKHKAKIVPTKNKKKACPSPMKNRYQENELHVLSFSQPMTSEYSQ